MSNELDDLMSLLEEDAVAFVKSPGNINKIIELQRKARVMYESGVKPKKGSSEAAKVGGAELLEKLKLGPKMAEPVKRRF